MRSYTWYVSCSPRSPEKIRPELTELAKLDGCNWAEKNQDGDLVTQVRFAELLKELPTFEGSISESDPAFSARDRLAPMKTYGFAYVNSNNILKITPAGYQLIQGVRIQELFLKQLLKWQYPSWQHGGHPRTRHNYPPVETTNVFPFVETLRACYELDGLKKEDIAIYLLPLTNRENINETINKIRELRVNINSFSGRERFDFLANTHKDYFREIYSEQIATGNFRTRESSTTTVDDFLKKKINNSMDVADAAIRYFRASGLFTISSDYRRIIVSPLYRTEAERILNEIDFELSDLYTDVDRFYEYMGNPELPTLPWETKEELMTKSIQLGAQKEEVERMQVVEMKTYIEQSLIQKKQEKLREYMIKAQEEDEVVDIINTYVKIFDRDVVDRPLFLEWNTWRALVAINDCEEPRPNFTLDDELKPFSIAPGNKADMEIQYNNKFVVLVEVTLSGGQRQYDTEGEPVTRHIGKFQKMESEKDNPLDVYGLFLAPSINPATRNYFYVHLKYHEVPEFGGLLKIIPLTTQQFIYIFRFIKNLKCFNRNILRELLDRIVALKDETEDGNEWVQKIAETIEQWKSQWSKDNIA